MSVKVWLMLQAVDSQFKLSPRISHVSLLLMAPFSYCSHRVSDTMLQLLKQKLLPSYFTDNQTSLTLLKKETFGRCASSLR